MRLFAIIKTALVPNVARFLCFIVAGIHLWCTPVGAETISYTYDVNGQVTMVEYPDGSVVTHTFDKMGNRQSRVVSGTTNEPPTVTTDSATGVTGSGATLNATVNANNHDTIVTFEYGTTTAYGSSVSASQNPVTGTVSTAVSRSITGLSSGTIYHYRAIGVSSAGTTTGSDETFMTSGGGAAPTVTTDNATGVTASGATLNATVNANNNATVVTFEYGTTTDYGMVVPASQNPVTGTLPTAVSRAITGLNPGTLYHYRAVAISSAGTGSGSDKTFTTIGTLTGVVINGGAVYTVNPKVTLTIGAYPAATKMQLNYTVKGWGKAEALVASKVITLPKGDGLKPVSVRYLDANGTALGESSASIVLDTKAPTGFVVINGGAKLTNNRDLILAIVATDITSGLATLCIREDKLPCGEGEYSAYTVPTKSFTLTSPEDGKKTVYVTLLDQAGKASKQLKASITLDTLAPTGSVSINGGKDTTVTPVVKLKLKALKASEMQLSLDGGTTWGDWMKFATSKTVTLPGGAGEKTVKVRFRDLAGNESPEYQDSIILQ